MNQTTHCRICGQPASAQPIGRVINDRFPLLQCTVCQTIQAPAETDADTPAGGALYDDLYGPAGDAAYDQHNDEVARLLQGEQPYRPYQARLLARVASLCPGRRLLEIGGGVGIFGRIAVAQGWDYTNYDVSEVALQQARQLGLRTQRIESTHLDLPRASAELIVLWEVIEHLSNVGEYLQTIRQALAPGGLLLMSTPYYWRTAYQRSDAWGTGMAPPVHLNFFTEESLRKTLRLNGFEHNNVFVRRLYPPAGKSLRALTQPLKYLLGLEAPPTLYSISH